MTDPNLVVKVTANALVVTTYGCIVFSSRVPALKRRGYILNLCGLSICAWAVLLTQPNPVWLSVWLLNLIFQNAILAAPPAAVRN